MVAMAIPPPVVVVVVVVVAAVGQEGRVPRGDGTRLERQAHAVHRRLDEALGTVVLP
jgi:hypothetical protein